MITFISEMWQELVAAGLILAIGWFWGRWRAILSWKSKQFKDRVVLALNTFHKDGEKQKLTLRTLFERDIYQVMQNTSMVDIVNKALDGVTVENPLLNLPKGDAWYILNAVLNQIAEQFSSGTLRRDMGHKITSKWYTFCLTFEKEGGIRMQKIRIMLIQKDALLNLPDSSEILLESERHSTRVKTLHILKKEYQNNPHLFMDMEIYQ